MSFSVEQATNCLEYALQNHELQVSVLRIDWSLWRGLGVTQRISPRFAHLLRDVNSVGTTAADDWASADHLRNMPAAERSAMVEKMLRAPRREVCSASLPTNCPPIAHY
ncbi:MAG: hypothetical protein R3C56_37565 [Pirellulaceae bacterium]